MEHFTFTNIISIVVGVIAICGGAWQFFKFMAKADTKLDKAEFDICRIGLKNEVNELLHQIQMLKKDLDHKADDTDLHSLLKDIEVTKKDVEFLKANAATKEDILRIEKSIERLNTSLIETSNANQEKLLDLMRQLK